MAGPLPITLKSLLVQTKTVEADFPGFDGFKVSLAYLTKDTLLSIRKKSTKPVFKSRQASEELDDELFLKLYTQAAIKGWKGFKLKYLEQLAPVDLSGQDLEDELPFSEEDALFMMKNSTAFDHWISETITDLGNFQTNKSSK